MGMLKKPMSILLSLLMIVSLFTIVPFPVGAESAVYTLTVENFEPSPTNDYDENIALETKIGGSVTEGTSHSVQSGTQISVTQDAVAYELSQGHPVLINVGIGKFSAVGHFMVLAGVAEDGTFILNDPNNLENSSKTWSWGDLSTEITAAWSYSYAGS